MTAEEALSEYGLVPRETDVPELRKRLAEELAQYSWETGNDDLIKVFCVQLFAHGRVEDSLLIWQAKNASFDLSCSVDVQLVCGAGLQATKEFLERQSTKEASDALRYICDCEKTGDFRGFSPAGHLEFYKEYYSAT